jgi:DNA polymerase III epsilon subunit-like protein
MSPSIDSYKQAFADTWTDGSPVEQVRFVVLDSETTGFSPVLDRILTIGAVAVLDGEIESRGADHAWTLTELHDLGHVPHYQPGGWDTITMHVLFVDGHWGMDTETSKVLGLAFGGEHVVIFKKTIQDTCAGAPLLVRERVCALAELGVWTHEVGHLLGLVDNGLPMVVPHKDATHGAHDVSDECIMHWAWEGQDLVTLLTDRVIAGNDQGLGFDAACQADIAAVRNR